MWLVFIVLFITIKYYVKKLVFEMLRRNEENELNNITIRANSLLYEFSKFLSFFFIGIFYENARWRCFIIGTWDFLKYLTEIHTSLPHFINKNSVILTGFTLIYLLNFNLFEILKTKYIKNRKCKEIWRKIKITEFAFMLFYMIRFYWSPEQWTY